MDLKSTLNLPDSDFGIPMKADLPKREPAIQQIWAERNAYQQILKAREGCPTFVLHDGPPYTNNPVHIGTAMNKILKDFVLKSRSMMGFKTPYVPGYDNHGLPIEQAVMKKFTDKKITPTITELRQACRQHAQEYLDIQSAQFQRLGVLGLWEKPYKTMDYKFEAGIIRVFKELVAKGFVYKGLRPTLWSPTSRTALADTEIIYKDVVSKAIYVRFKLKKDPNRLFEKFSNLYTIIWTTTPWTIPANLACAFHPDLEYSVVQVGSDHYLVLNALLPKIAEKLGWTDPKVVETLEGINMESMVFQHPIWDRDSIAVMADYVTTEDGTGVVHTAPGHGRDDFYTGQKYNLPVLCPVDEKGVLTAEAHEFEGQFYKNCDKTVLDKLREVGALLLEEDYQHSYPHAERDEQPVIFRATEQWFVRLDHDELRKNMLDQISYVKWVPAQGEKRISSMIASRPDWCISRQRPWGVGIPIFYGAESRKPVMDLKAIEAVAKLVEEQGSDAWFTVDPSTILPAGYKHPQTGETSFIKETDVLDVWFDSGSTSLCVIDNPLYPEWPQGWPADLYLEGSDQHRGWFNSSLVLGTAIKEFAPYKAVVTHGFVMDDKGQKMSKRLGNIVEPVAACEQYGADVLRYWLGSVDYTTDAPCSPDLLKTFGEHYRKVRNTLKFLMSNLYDEDVKWQGNILELDEWAMEQVDLLADEVVQSYEAYNFKAALSAIHNFCGGELSGFYLDSIKDRMYCDGADWPSRRSGQYACRYILDRLVRLLAPILPHTAEEANFKLNGDSAPLILTETFLRPDSERLAQIEGSNLQVRFASLLELRSEAFTAFEAWKTGAGVKDSQDVIFVISSPSDDIQSFSAEDLALYLKCSWVELSKGEARYDFKMSEYPKCERSRLRRPDVQQVGETWLSARDRKVLTERGVL